MALIIILQLLLLGLLASEISSTDVTVKTDIGVLIGIKRDINYTGDVVTIAKFLGVPYAEPPVGQYRFRRPRPKRQFTEPLTVQEFGSRCWELSPKDDATYSEDCLFLNMYVPGQKNKESLAVMVYIHGGGFERGSGQDYYSDFLAAFGKTVVVTINYRLSVWGFLRTDDVASPGNYGLWDQRLAIQWVHDNIGAFGGDNGRVTIFGESAGASAVIHQALYPGNKGLFQRVIAQSGSASAYFGINHTPRENAEAFAKVTGCYNKSATETVKCLRSLPADVIQDASQSVSPGHVPFFYPSVDNMFITCDPKDVLNLTLDIHVSAYQASREAFSSVDLLIGMNSMEGAEIMLYPAFGYVDPETFLPNKTHFDTVMVPALVDVLYGNQLNTHIRANVTEAIVKAYTHEYEPENPYRIREEFISMHTDATYLGPMYTEINAHTKLSKMRSYMYYLNINPLYHAISAPLWVKGANHADDILFIFPSELYPYVEDEIRLAFTMVGMWTNFAKTGNPNLPADVGVTWEPYTDANHRYLDITIEMTQASVKSGLREDRVDLWNTDIPEIIGEEARPCRYVHTTSGASTVSKTAWMLPTVLTLATLALNPLTALSLSTLSISCGDLGVLCTHFITNS